jgi:hypothetical protein
MSTIWKFTLFSARRAGRRDAVIRGSLGAGTVRDGDRLGHRRPRAATASARSISATRLSANRWARSASTSARSRWMEADFVFHAFVAYPETHELHHHPIRAHTGPQRHPSTVAHPEALRRGRTPLAAQREAGEEKPGPEREVSRDVRGLRALWSFRCLGATPAGSGSAAYRPEPAPRKIAGRTMTNLCDDSGSPGRTATD